MYCTRCGVSLPRSTDRFCFQCGSATVNAWTSAPPAGAPKRLLRSANDSRIAGICGGLAEYLDTDPTVVRLLFLCVTIFTGFVMGLGAYILAWIVIPKAQWYFVPVSATPSPAPPPPMGAHPASPTV